jgi:hypothetical protein
MNYKEDYVTADIRLIILRELKDTQGYRSNESVLQQVVEKYGHSCSRDCIRTQLSWLEEQALVTLADPGVLVATITQRGVDVARGSAPVPGVKRPSPGRN